jgi:hypothetical protein
MIFRIIFSLTLLVFFFHDASGQEGLIIKKDSIYFDSTLRQFARFGNMHRYRYVKKYPRREKLINLKVKTEAIDWLGIYRNIIVEKKGECDSIVYIVCHYDKLDGNIFAFINLFLNGYLDIVLTNFALTQGAYDNGTGVVTSLGLLSWMNGQNTHYTYRFLFTGMEEYGLRGARRHVSGMDKSEWEKCFYAINIDMIGEKGLNGVTISQNVSNSALMLIAEKMSADSSYLLNKAFMPDGALSDYYIFMGQSFCKDFGISFMGNLTGAVFPQRSYFTVYKKGIPVINFTDDAKLSQADFLSMLSPVAFGEVHSYRDRFSLVDPKNLVEYHNFLKDYILFIDTQRNLRVSNRLPYE